MKHIYVIITVYLHILYLEQDINPKHYWLIRIMFAYKHFLLRSSPCELATLCIQRLQWRLQTHLCLKTGLKSEYKPKGKAILQN